MGKKLPLVKPRRGPNEERYWMIGVDKNGKLYTRWY